MIQPNRYGLHDFPGLSARATVENREPICAGMSNLGGRIDRSSINSTLDSWHHLVAIWGQLPGGKTNLTRWGGIFEHCKRDGTFTVSEISAHLLGRLHIKLLRDFMGGTTPPAPIAESWLTPCSPQRRCKP